ncbi:hypothetical protein LUZ60_001351 [Juncus effusus]|nr:hypothetical protein LUZ60_001351 [Juncus effusus]
MAKSLCLVVFSLLGLVAIAAADSGDATYYTAPYTPSSCYGYTDEGTMIAAASDAIWDNRAACGRMYSITCTGANNGAPYPCTGATVTVKIVDYCPNCNGTFDLSQEVFQTLSTNLAVGNILIDYNQV